MANTSKLITAVAILKLLRDLSLDPMTTDIVDFLPAYWNPHTSVNAITFHELLQHRAGFCRDGWIYLSARRQVESGIGPAPCATKGIERYRNVNHVVLRILVATLSGKVALEAWNSAPLSVDRDALWDWASREAYKEYVWNNVFEPSGVGNIPVVDFPDTALAYRAPPNTLVLLPNMTQPGWDFGNEGAGAGAIGWQMTADEVVKFMQALRAGQLIANPEELFQNAYGMMASSTFCGPFGQTTYFWGGVWSEPSTGTADQRRQERNVIPLRPAPRSWRSR